MVYICFSFICQIFCQYPERKYAATLSNHVGNKQPSGKEKTLLSSLASELTRDTVQLTVNKVASHSTTSSPAMAMFDSTPKVPAITYNLGSLLGQYTQYSFHFLLASFIGFCLFSSDQRLMIVL